MSEANTLSELKRAIEAQDWIAAGKAADVLRMRHRWNYARMCEEFGRERWEEIATEIDDAEAQS